MQIFFSLLGLELLVQFSFAILRILLLDQRGHCWLPSSVVKAKKLLLNRIYLYNTILVNALFRLNHNLSMNLAEVAKIESGLLAQDACLEQLFDLFWI